MNFSENAQFTPDQGITNGGDPLTLGKRHFANRNFGLAIEAFEEARHLAPDSVNVLNALAVAYEEIGRADLADSYFLEALDVDPSSAQTYNNWAMVHLGRGNAAKAEQLLAEAARLAPGDPMVAGNMARIDATDQGDATIQAETATGSLTSVIAELQPKPEDWKPSIRSVAPHVYFLATTPPEGAPAMVADTGTIPTVLHAQIATAEFAPMPDPSIEQAPPPPAVPIAPVVEFELDNPAAADAALIALATAEAGRTIVPVGASSAESEDGGGQIVRPGRGAVVTVVDDADAMLASLPAPLADPVIQTIPAGAIIVSAELMPAEQRQPVSVGSWARDETALISSAAEDAIGEVVTVASVPADALLIRPGADPADAGSGAKLIGVGETVEPAVDPGRVIVPVPAWTADVGSIEPVVTAPSTIDEPAPVAVAALIEPETVDESPDSMIRTVAFGEQMATGTGSVRAAPASLAMSVPDDFLSVAAVLPPTSPVETVVADASARVPMIVAVFAGPEPVAPETAVADNSFATSLPLASAARIPSVVAVLAMVEAGTQDGPNDADIGIDD